MEVIWVGGFWDIIKLKESNMDIIFVMNFLIDKGVNLWRNDKYGMEFWKCWEGMYWDIKGVIGIVLRKYYNLNELIVVLYRVW